MDVSRDGNAESLFSPSFIPRKTQNPNKWQVQEGVAMFSESYPGCIKGVERFYTPI